ncbi:hypothetical protein DUNSADRAFT_14753 [Dunaliella salina]|uniref:Smr domain-containing protein n=1 Tax=Dunaliella salina TaxID=3046 RepID=A0ABQ7G6U9_DUNSA|nr:hypothetical protein DUNSADRAFT_14753 [Dunaliella salina]|eukprot:KAF5830322.1 hypothetical protein DUNSADRAFT_14753 [Dunaliella salina]
MVGTLRGQHELAKKKSEEGKKLDSQAKKHARKAADATFAQNNTGRPANEVDLHGLYVDEALERVEKAISNARWSQLLRCPVAKDITFIVGKGLHSQDGVAKIRPAVLKLVNRYYLRVTEDTPNAGCIHVEFLNLSEFNLHRWARMLVSWAPTMVAGVGVLLMILRK